MGSNLGADPRSVEGLVVGRLLTVRERDSIASRSISSLSTFAFTTLGSPEQKRSERATKRELLDFTITNKFDMVLQVIP